MTPSMTQIQPHTTYALSALAKHLNGYGMPCDVVGDADKRIVAVNTLNDAGPDEISFLSNAKYVDGLKTTRAGAVIVSKDQETPEGMTVLRAADAYAAAVSALSAALLAVPSHVESTVTTNYVTNGLPPGAYTGAPAGPPQGPIPQDDGGDWMVTEPTLFLAGEAGPERATFTPMDGGCGGGGGLTIQNLTINAPGATANELYAMLNANDIRRRTGARS